MAVPVITTWSLCFWYIFRGWTPLPQETIPIDFFFKNVPNSPNNLVIENELRRLKGNDVNIFHFCAHNLVQFNYYAKMDLSFNIWRFILDMH